MILEFVFCYNSKKTKESQMRQRNEEDFSRQTLIKIQIKEKKMFIEHSCFKNIKSINFEQYLLENGGFFLC